MAVTTSIVVQFSQGTAGGSLSAEVDSRPNGLNGGKTSFAPGDQAKFLVFKTDDVVLDQVISSAGSITPLGGGLYEVEEWLTFSDSNEANLQKPFYSDLVYQWYGNNLGALTVAGTKVTSAVKGLGVAKVTYKAYYAAYGLSSPSMINGKSEFQIAVLVQGHN